MREAHVAATIIQFPDSYILHEREKGVDKGEVGKLGLYGGRIEEDETNPEAASRELEEESGLLFLPDDFVHLGFTHVISERKGKRILTEAEIFLLTLPLDTPVEQFHAGIQMSPREISRARALGKLSSLAKESFTKFTGL